MEGWRRQGWICRVALRRRCEGGMGGGGFLHDFFVESRIEVVRDAT